MPAGLPKANNKFKGGSPTRTPSSKSNEARIARMQSGPHYFMVSVNVMAFDGLLVTEIFYSLQGETSTVGKPTTFVRLTGCNLRCVYCDTAYAFKGGTRMSIPQILEEVARFNTLDVLLTGGEPLLQRQTVELARQLGAGGYRVSIETHGEHPIDAIAPHARVVMDVKTPASRMGRGGFERNLPFLKPGDEIKFVLCSESDYLWAREWLQSGKLPAYCEVLLSPVMGDGALEPKNLATWMLRDQVRARFQLQLHKQLWGNERGR